MGDVEGAKFAVDILAAALSGKPGEDELFWLNATSSFWKI